MTNSVCKPAAAALRAGTSTRVQRTAAHQESALRRSQAASRSAFALWKKACTCCLTSQACSIWWPSCLLWLCEMHAQAARCTTAADDVDGPQHSEQGVEYTCQAAAGVEQQGKTSVPLMIHTQAITTAATFKKLSSTHPATSCSKESPIASHCCCCCC
jgi:hypothetical protein